MNERIVYYAKCNIDEVENGIKVNIIPITGSLYIQTKTGRSFKLADAEVKQQAIEFLQSEIEFIKQS